ncbi:MAG: insulinase family protein [Bacteroidales bacterium]|nr:insulinase family protein [Bacteroidales bacterium]
MKNKLIIAFVFTFLFQAAFTQTDRSKPPKPAPAPEIKIGEYQSFKLKNGLQVFVVENHKIPKVSYSLVFKFDPILEGENAGYVDIAGQLIGTATKTRTKNQIDEETDFIGANLSASSTSVFASSLKKHNEKLLELMSDVILNAEFKEEELEKIRKQTLSGIAFEKDDPSSISDNVANVILYGKSHPYGEIETENTVNQITLEQCKKFYSTYYRPNIAYLAIVGDINVKEAKVLIKKYFDSWTSAEVPSAKYNTPEAPAKRTVAIVDRPNAVQSVVKVTYPVNLKIGDENYIKARVMNTILGGGTYRLFQNLRETHGFTYGAYSSLDADQIIGSFTASADVANAVTDSSVTEILYEMERLRTEKVPEEELTRAKNNLSGSFALSLERPETVARFALNIARYNLPKDYYANYLKNLEAVTAEDIMAMANLYLKPENSYVFIVGKAEEVSNKIKIFSPDGQLVYYDTEGNTYDPAERAKAVPAGLTGKMVFDKYFEAIGGRDKYASIQDIWFKMSANMQGMTLQIDQYQKAPDKFAMQVAMNGNIIQKQVFDGAKGKSIQMGQEMEITGKELDRMKLRSKIDVELNYEENGVSSNLKSIEDVDGKKAYLIELLLPTGETTSEYFDVETGLKLKTVSTMEAQGQTINQSITYDDYKDVDGLLFPFKMNQSIGPQSFDINVESVQINSGIEDSIFE